MWIVLLCLFCVGTIGIGVILGRQLTNQQDHVGFHAATLPVAGDRAQLLDAVGEAT